MNAAAQARLLQDGGGARNPSTNCRPEWQSASGNNFQEMDGGFIGANRVTGFGLWLSI
jgi:hypothetical protein